MRIKSMLINTAFCAMFFIGATNCCARNSSEKDRIDNVERGLIDAETLADEIGLLFDTKRTDTLEKFDLGDRMKAYHVPGVSIAVINDYKLDWAKGYGVLKAGNNDMITTETLFQAASASKPLATAIVLRLVEEGRLNLDEDVNAYLKTWKIPYDTMSNKVTLRLLITHKAGINRPGQGYGYEDNSSPTLVQVLKGEAPALNDPFHFDHSPGTAYQYSNFGYMIIQLVLEDLLNKPYQDIVKYYIFDPLKMNSSLMQYPFPLEVFVKLSKPHNQAGVTQDYGLHPSALGNAGLVTTPTDLAKFVIELMLSNKGRSELLVGQKSAKTMLTKTADVDPREFSGFSQLGFGVFLLGEGKYRYFVHPGANNSGISCVFAASPSSGDGVVIMTNGLMGLYLSMEIIASIAHEYGWHDIK